MIRMVLKNFAKSLFVLAMTSLVLPSAFASWTMCFAPQARVAVKISEGYFGNTPTVYLYRYVGNQIDWNKPIATFGGESLPRFEMDWAYILAEGKLGKSEMLLLTDPDKFGIQGGQEEKVWGGRLYLNPHLAWQINADEEDLSRLFPTSVTCEFQI